MTVGIFRVCARRASCDRPRKREVYFVRLGLGFLERLEPAKHGALEPQHIMRVLAERHDERVGAGLGMADVAMTGRHQHRALPFHSRHRFIASCSEMTRSLSELRSPSAAFRVLNTSASRSNLV